MTPVDVSVMAGIAMAVSAGVFKGMSWLGSGKEGERLARIETTLTMMGEQNTKNFEALEKRLDRIGH